MLTEDTNQTTNGYRSSNGVTYKKRDPTDTGIDCRIKTD